MLSKRVNRNGIVANADVEVTVALYENIDKFNKAFSDIIKAYPLKEILIDASVDYWLHYPRQGKAMELDTRLKNKKILKVLRQEDDKRIGLQVLLLDDNTCLVGAPYCSDDMKIIFNK